MKRSLRCSMRLHRNGTILGLIVMGASVGVAARAQTAPASATFTVGTPGTFPVAANGDPAPVIGLKSQDPHLPPSIQFDRASGTLGNDATARQGFGLGVGYESIPAAQTLGDEFVDGKPAPLGPDGKTPLPLRYETRDKGSLLVIFSVVF